MNKVFIGQYLRAKQVAEYLSVGLSSVWAMAKNNPDFPRPLRLGPRTTVWDRDQLDTFVERRAGRGAQ